MASRINHAIGHFSATQLRQLSLILYIVVLGTFLASCGQEAAPQVHPPATNALSRGIEEAEVASGRQFERDSAMQETLGDGAIAYGFSGLDGASTLTVIVRDGIDEATWNVSYLQDGSIYRMSSAGESEQVTTPLVSVQARCTYCADLQWRPPYWVENWVTRAIKDFLPYTVAAACHAAGGIWTGGACYVIVNMLVDEGYWTTGYWECVEWRPIDPSGVCIED